MSMPQRRSLLTGICGGMLILLLASSGLLADEEVDHQPEDWERRLEMLRSVPYLAFSESTVDESDTGVVIYNPQKAYPGYNLYCTRWTGEAFLLDMSGRVAHRWRYLSVGGRGSYHHVDMLENGDLLVIKEYKELLRLNWDAKLMWEKEMVVHHDVAQDVDGSLYTIVREYRVHRGMGVWFDAIVHLAPDGEVIDRWSSYDHLNELKEVLDKNSFLDTILDSVLAGRSGDGKGAGDAKKALERRPEGLDYFHLNSVSVLPTSMHGEGDVRFQKGNLLICSRHVNQIAILEKKTYRPLWAWGEGELEWPHHATMLANGNILLFDNGIHRQYSRVIELDPVSKSVVWMYSSEPAELFYSKSRSSAQRLPNGNTLICESDDGRVFEVTGEGEVVWMWLNPSIEEGHREGLYRMMRLPADRIERLLQRPWWRKLLDRLRR